MKNLIPQFIQEKYLKDNISGWLKGTVMSIDLKGFTNMTEKLMKHSHLGAETLSDIINTLFEPIIDMIHSDGGFITAFIGDAITAVFPDDFAFNAERSGSSILKIIKKKKEIKVDKKRFSINARIGIAYGRVIWKIHNFEERSIYFFKGGTVDNAADAQQKAVPGRMKIHSSYTAEKGQETNKVPVRSKFKKEVLQRFIPDKVLEMKSVGEFREIVSIFITFNEKSTDMRLFTKFLCKESVRYKGYLDKIDFGDKGGIALVVFGAPIKAEKYAEHAMSFASELIKKFKLIRVGMTKGISYCGLVGSDKRADYSVLGKIVNLSARLTSICKKGKICCDKSIAEYDFNNTDFKILNTYKLKGIREKIPVYQPYHTIKKVKHIAETEFVGREKEIQTIIKFLEPVFKENFAGYLQVNGNAGVGKTRLIEAALDKIGKNKLNQFIFSCDNIVNKSFQPAISFLNQHIGLTEDIDNQKKEELLSLHLNDLRSNSDLDISNDDFIRIDHYIGILLGLEKESKELGSLEAQVQYENTIFALKNYVLLNSAVKPVVLIIDDIHKIDDHTMEMLRFISRSDKNTPVCILATARYLENGNEFKPDIDEISSEIISLKTLTKASTKAIISSILNSDISEILFNSIWDKSSGNPFYTEQLTLFIKESGHLQLKNGILTLDLNEYKIPEKISSVIISRIDKLSHVLRTSVKTASVLGKEFSAIVLSKMLKKENITEHLKTIEKEAFWSNITEMFYIFKHALIRDSIYQMQLKKTLKQLHSLAAKTIKSVYKDDINKHSPDLAFHYEKAGDEKNTYKYLHIATFYSYQNYHLKEALEYGLKLMELENDKLKLSEVKRTVGAVYYTLGDWSNAEKYYLESIEIVNHKKNSEQYIKSLSTYSEYLIAKGEPDKALKNFKICLKISVKIKMKYYEAHNLNNIGGIYRVWGDFHKAIEYYDKALNILKRTSYEMDLCATYDNLGIAYQNIGEFETAEKNFLTALEMIEKQDDPQGRMTILNNMGNIYYYQGQTDKAFKIFDQALEIAEKLGDMRKKGIINGHLGSIYFYKGENQKALDFYTKSLNISYSLGDKNSESYVSGNLGVMNRILGNNKEAFYFFDRQLELSKKIKNKLLIGIATGNLGFMYSLVGDFKTSNDMYLESINVSESVDDKISLSTNYSNIGYNYRAIGDMKKSLKYYKDSIQIAEDLNLKYNLLSTYYYFAELLFIIGKKKDTKEYLKKGKALCEELQRSDYLLKCITLEAVMNKNNKTAPKEKDLLAFFDDPLSNEQQGLLNKTLYKITGKKKYRTEALKIYKALYKKFKYYDYKTSLEELK